MSNKNHETKMGMEIGGECGMRKVLSCVLVMVLLASAVPLTITPATAISEIYEEKIAGDTDENGELTKEELVSAILPYMLEEGDLELDDVGDAAYVYAHWDGEPKAMIDEAERSVTFYRPIERVVSTSMTSTRITFALDRCDRFVGSEYVCVNEEQFACGGKMTEIVEDLGRGATNVEQVASLRPDMIFGSSRNADVLQDQTGAVVVVYSPSSSGLSQLESWYIQIENIGAVLGREEEAEDLISFMEEKIALVTDISSQIDDSEKPRVYFASRTNSQSITRTTGYYYAIDYAGGINVAKEDAITTSEFSVSKEDIIKWDPDIMVLKCHRSNPPSSRQYTIEMALLDPELQAGNVNAVKNGTVYYCMATCRSYPIQRYIPEAMYLAKIFHPEKFKDLDLEKEGNEIMEKFLGAEGLYTWLADDSGYLRDLIENPPEEGEW